MSFEEAKTIFDNPLALIFDDKQHSVDEHREIISGHSRNNQLLLVSYLNVPMQSVSLMPVSPLAENVKIMNKMPFDQPSNSEDELLPEYQFDYKKAKPNRFANRSGKSKLTVVVLDEDVAEVFSTPESVNKVLRALIEAMPQASSGETV